MATSINTLKNWFKTGMFPTQAQFWAWIDSFRHKDDKVPVTDIEGLNELLTPVNEHFNDPYAHTELFDKVSEINTIIFDSGFIKQDNVFKAFADSRWNLKAQEFTNSADIEIPIPLCAAGMVRTDRVVLNMNNQFVLVQGVEVADNPVAQSKPVNTLDYTFIPVNDTEVGDPTPPILGTVFQKKTFDKIHEYNASGTNVVIPFHVNGYNTIELSGSVTSISGFSFSDLAANPSDAEYPHDGKSLYIINRTGHNVTLNNSDFASTAVVFFAFDSGSNLVVPNNGKFELKYTSAGLKDIFKSWESELLGDIQLPAYTSSRNDGSNPNGKILNVDAFGNLKLYSMPIMPPPYLEELIPDSYLPDNTGNFIIKGSFFTPNTTVTVEGQTLHYLTFISDNEMLANITTGPTEGTFDITINNGISVVFPDALLIVLGDVYKPSLGDWIDIVEPVNLDVDGELKVELYDFLASATINPDNIVVNPAVDFRFQYNYEITPFEEEPFVNFTTKVTFYRVSDDVPVYSLHLYLSGAPFFGYGALNIFENENLTVSNLADISLFHTPTNWKRTIRMEKIGGVLALYCGTTLLRTFAYVETLPMYVKFETQRIDFLNIKYIELM